MKGQVSTTNIGQKIIKGKKVLPPAKMVKEKGR